ncbi:MAG: hypothetical protein WAW86_05775 [Gammaproteobacteria bacterium]
MTAKTNPKTIRLEQDLQSTVDKWLKQHPDFNMSILANMAIRRFVSNDQTLEAVEVTSASKHDVKKSLEKLLVKHKKTLDELK